MYGDDNTKDLSVDDLIYKSELAADISKIYSGGEKQYYATESIMFSNLAMVKILSKINGKLTNIDESLNL